MGRDVSTSPSAAERITSSVMYCARSYATIQLSALSAFLAVVRAHGWSRCAAATILGMRL